MELRCPTCHERKRVTEDYPHRPFCSERCKMVDLGRWLDEGYRISQPLNPDDPELPLN
jgi:endogenous inhibitor of DNA gyrase (YacG/DUF329 family)